MRSFPTPTTFGAIPIDATFHRTGDSNTIRARKTSDTHARWSGPYSGYQSFALEPSDPVDDVITAEEAQAEYEARRDAERKAEADRTAAFVSKVAAVARALAKLLEHPATVDKREGSADRYSGISLMGGKGFSLCLDNANRRDRISISGRLPIRKGETYQRSSGSITVAADKSPDAIARDIARRLVPEYFAAWDKASAEKAQAEKYAADRKALAMALVEASDGATWNDTRDGGVVAGNMHWSAEVWDDSASFTIRNLSPKAAVALVKALARIRPASEE